MGIRGLTGWIQYAAPSSIETKIDWKQLCGKRVGVDILGFLYRAKTQRLCVFETLACLVEAFQRYEIEPVIIFDGKPPDAKKATLQQRTETRTPSPTAFTSGERDLCKQLLYACGVLCLNACGEADDLLAYLSRRGDLDAVFSNDLDLLSRGVEHLYVPHPRNARCFPGDERGWTHYRLSSILFETQFSYEDFLDLCVIMGSDYTTGLPSLPYKQAYESIKYIRNLSSTLRRMKVVSQTPYYDAKARLRGDFATETSLMGEKQWEKWAAGSPKKEYEALTTFRTTLLATLDDEVYSRLSTHCGSRSSSSNSSQHRSESAAVCTHNHPESSDCQDEQDEEQYGGKQDVRKYPVDDVRYDWIQDRLDTRLVFRCA